MNIKIEFTHFIITELLYKILDEKSDEPYKNTSNEQINQNTQGRLAIEKEMNNCIFELVTDLKTYIDQDPIRTLEFSVQFHFKLIHDINMESKEEKDESLEMIQREFGGPILEYCKNRISVIIREITSLDYQPPIINESVAVEISN